MRYLAYVLTSEQRDYLLGLFPPRYPTVKADHITIYYGETDKRPAAKQISVIGRADNQHGIEALIVTVNGQTRRDDGFPYHITWSFNPNKTAPADLDIAPDPLQRQARPYQPSHSNRLVLDKGSMRYLETPIIIGSFQSSAIS